MKKIDDSTLNKVSSFAAFLIPAAALWLNSGYGYGVAVFLLAALCFFSRWTRFPQSKLTIGIALSFLAMGLLWYELSAFSSGMGRWDRSAKYILSVPCLLYAVVFPPKREAFYWGLVVGCAGAGLLGLWQISYLGFARANGTTNAIQWGNIALLMATMVAIQLAIFWHELSWKHRVAVIVCIMLGVEASILSASRGGWIALIAVVPLMSFFIFRYRRGVFIKFCVGLVTAGLLLAMTNSSMLSERWKLAENEVAEYLNNPDKVKTVSSLGVRLEQYRGAVEMIAERPVLGWGMRGYLDEMHKRVDEGRYAPSIREFNFVHNEFIDLWVKTGFVGSFIQAFLYIYILVIFWPTPLRMKKWEAHSAVWKDELALRLCGITLPTMYFMFGQSQHFFVHNSGIIMYLFTVIILWSALSGLKDRQSPIPNR